MTDTRESGGTAGDAGGGLHVGLAAGRGVAVVIPTYNERENLEGLVEAILNAVPEASLLVVDDK